MNIKTELDESIITLNGENKRFFQSKASRQLLVGTASVGKTYTGMLKLHFLCTKYPNTKVLLCRKALPSLRNTAVKTYQHILSVTNSEKQVRVLDESRPTEFIYQNGSRIELGLIGESWKFLGAEFDVVYIHEPAMEGLTLDEFLLTSSKARLNNTGGYRVIAEGTLPIEKDGKREHWIYSLPEKGFEVFNPTHKDNPALYNWTDLGRTYMKQLDALADIYKKSQIEGKWL